jgi:putative transposase
MEERLLVCDTIRHFDGSRYKLYAWVVMNDHVHVVLRLLNDFQLDKVTHTWKSFSANQLQRLFGRVGSIWVTESWDRVVRDDAELMEKCLYVLNNPAKRWPGTVDYPACGWGGE